MNQIGNITTKIEAANQISHFHFILLGPHLKHVPKPVPNLEGCGGKRR